MKLYCDICEKGVKVCVTYEYEDPEGDYTTTRLFAVGSCPMCGKYIKILMQDIGEPKSRDIEYKGGD